LAASSSFELAIKVYNDGEKLATWVNTFIKPFFFKSFSASVNK
jgi:hypothetical protein